MTIFKTSLNYGDKFVSYICNFIYIRFYLFYYYPIGQSFEQVHTQNKAIETKFFKIKTETNQDLV